MTSLQTADYKGVLMCMRHWILYMDSHMLQKRQGTQSLGILDVRL